MGCAPYTEIGPNLPLNMTICLIVGYGVVIDGDLDNQRCKACHTVGYCCKEHQKSDWKTHKPSCLIMRCKLEEDTSPLDGGHKAKEYVGTLAWSLGKKFERLPPFPKAWPPPLGGDDWKGFMQWRFGEAQGDEVCIEAATLDGMSFPVTLAYAFYKLRLVVTMRGAAEVRVILIGAAARTEERLLLETSYWAELGALLPDIDRLNLCFVGPEVSRESHEVERDLSAKVRAVCFRGALHQFLSESKEVAARPLDSHPTVVVGFNTGFGNTNRQLTREWLPSLREVAERRLPAVFTCVNDFADLRGELLIWRRAVGARVVMDPMRNAFRAVTVQHAEGERTTSWYCANCFLYAVQGYQGDLPALREGRQPPSLSLSDLRAAVDAVWEWEDNDTSGSERIMRRQNPETHVLDLPPEEAAAHVAHMHRQIETTSESTKLTVKPGVAQSDARPITITASAAPAKSGGPIPTKTTNNKKPTKRSCSSNGSSSGRSSGSDGKAVIPEGPEVAPENGRSPVGGTLTSSDSSAEKRGTGAEGAGQGYVPTTTAVSSAAAASRRGGSEEAAEGNKAPKGPPGERASEGPGGPKKTPEGPTKGPNKGLGDGIRVAGDVVTMATSFEVDLDELD